jgi:hypothetical protein
MNKMSGDHKSSTIYFTKKTEKPAIDDPELYVTFSRKDMIFDRKQVIHLIMNNVTNQIKLLGAREKANALKIL